LLYRRIYDKIKEKEMIYPSLTAKNGKKPSDRL